MRKKMKTHGTWETVATQGRTLLKMLKETEKIYKLLENHRIKFIVTGGQKYADQLRINDPFEVKRDPKE